MNLSREITTFGQLMRRRHGQRVHKVSINAAFTCPNRDGSKGRGGCTFCNNVSFSPNARRPDSIAQQVSAGRRIIRKRTKAKKLLAYFQAYTNTYGDIETLRRRYDEALAEPDVIGLSVGTRPDCISQPVIDLLREYHDRGLEVWLELGLQSAFDETLRRINRGHGFAEYQAAAGAARRAGLQLCTHLIVGLPGETPAHNAESLRRVLGIGVDGLKLHPLHVVKGTALASDWRRGTYRPLELDEYVDIAVVLVEQTPPEVAFHRLTATASPTILLAPQWCAKKWLVLNRIEQVLRERRRAACDVA